jgi:molybdopterin synthase catalytic subunit
MILTPPTNSVLATTTTTTTASTLTQETLEESLNKIRQDTDQKLNLFRTEICHEFGSIEDKIMAAVVKAVSPAQEIDTNNSTATDANSNMTTAHLTTHKQSALLRKKWII